MLKKFFYAILLINITSLTFNMAETNFAKRQKLIFSLSQDLFVKNILLIKQPLGFDAETISFAKSLSQSNIYFSSPPLAKIQSFINSNVYSRITFSKTLILAHNENLNAVIYKLISTDEMAQSKFLWLVWSDKNQAILQDGGFYIPYNSIADR